MFITSSARIATLRDTSCDRLIIHLGYHIQKKQCVASSCKLELARFSTLLRIQDRAKCGKGRGDIAQKTDILEGGNISHALLRWGHCTYLIGVGTPHMPYWGGDKAHS